MYLLSMLQCHYFNLGVTQCFRHSQQHLDFTKTESRYSRHNTDNNNLTTEERGQKKRIILLEIIVIFNFWCGSTGVRYFLSVVDNRLSVVDNIENCFYDI